jgi:hypothetical protein
MYNVQILQIKRFQCQIPAEFFWKNFTDKYEIGRTTFLITLLIFFIFLKHLIYSNYAFVAIYIIWAKDMKNNWGQNCTLVKMCKLKFESYLKLYYR